MKIHDLVAPAKIPSMSMEELGHCLLRVVADHIGEHAMHMVTQTTVTDLAADAGQDERVPPARRRELQPALDRAFNWLERQGLLIPAEGLNGRNGYFVFGHGAQELLDRKNFETYRTSQSFPEALLHPSISANVWMAIARGDFDRAVRDAFQTVEETVRAAGKFRNTDIGVRLMQAAFDPTGGPLARMADAQGEREGLRDLFVGAMKSYRNPHSHRTVGITDMSDAYEQVMFASHLIRIADSRRLP